jgi:hypothetical protein
MMQIEVSREDAVKLNEYTYITRSDMKYMKSFLKKDGWEFEERLGAGYSFINSNGERLLLIGRCIFAGRYIILEDRRSMNLQSSFLKEKESVCDAALQNMM